MKTKITELLSSRRFWLLTLALAVSVLKSWGDWATILNEVQVYILAVVGIGTVDSVAQKIAGTTTEKVTDEELVELAK